MNDLNFRGSHQIIVLSFRLFRMFLSIRVIYQKCPLISPHEAKFHPDRIASNSLVSLPNRKIHTACILKLRAISENFQVYPGTLSIRLVTQHHFVANQEDLQKNSFPSWGLLASTCRCRTRGVSTHNFPQSSTFSYSSLILLLNILQETAQLWEQRRKEEATRARAIGTFEITFVLLTVSVCTVIHGLLIISGKANPIQSDRHYHTPASLTSKITIGKQSNSKSRPGEEPQEFSLCTAWRFRQPRYA